jgi:spore coat protein H
MKRLNLLSLILILPLLVLSSCSLPDTTFMTADTSSRQFNPEDPGQDSKNGGKPSYDTVFPQDKVNEVTITISPENWQLMMEDMTELFGEQGSSQKAGPLQPGRNPGQPPQEGERPALPGEDRPQEDQQGRTPGQPGGGFPGGNDDQNPVWVEAEITFEGQTWEHVGIRFKGNSSLRSTWGTSSLKLPFKLDFDQFEDHYPETEDQRFFGFKQLSFSSNYHDDSYLREKVAADLFREAGMPAAETAFYAVSVDYGEGPVYLGLYTAVEVVDDTVIETQFTDDEGNVYKPEGSGATFAAGSFSEASFDKETNQELDDYSDILALFDALHSDERISDPESWRENLEKDFDVDGFLNWLAVNTVIQNWDTYGVMNHNYYLYHDPESGQLVWIPWDNNESLKSGTGMRNALPLDLSGVSDEWPLISYLRDDPVYYQKYLEHLEAFLDEVFLPDSLAERFQTLHELISPYVIEEVQGSTIPPEGAFTSSVAELFQHVKNRATAAQEFLVR